MIFVADKDIKDIRSKLSKDANTIADRLDKNIQVIDLNMGKPSPFFLDQL